MAEPTVGRAVPRELRAIGVELAIDDFGTGYSSLAYLRDLPVTTLKIDRSFVTGLERDTRDARVIAAIVGLAQDFGLTTVTEGVETWGQLAALRDLGCDLVQGYLLGRPTPAAGFASAGRSATIAARSTSATRSAPATRSTPATRTVVTSAPAAGSATAPITVPAAAATATPATRAASLPVLAAAGGTEHLAPPARR